MKKRVLIKRIILLLITLYVFLLSIKLMGGAFKLFGAGFAEQLFTLTLNPFVGLFVGILATSLVQSSSVTTSIIVTLTASGALTAASAIPVIMGANIGTSVTSTIVSLGHITKVEEFKKAIQVATVHDFFNFIIVLILFPLELYFHFLERAAIFLTDVFLGASVGTFSSPLNLIIKPVAHAVQNFFLNDAFTILFFSTVVLFISLKAFVNQIKPLAETEFKDALNKHIFKSPARTFGLGLILTSVIQSSSLSTSFIVPLAGVGIITLEKAFPYILGANIGTTFTAFMASLVTGSPAALTVALEHILFNTTGSILIYPIRKVPIAMAKWLANLTLKNKFYPIAYVAATFYVLPFCVVMIFQYI